MNKKLIVGVVVVVVVAVLGVLLMRAKGSSAPYSAPVTKNPDAIATTTYALADVAAHKDGASCWTAIGGGVYDLTSWISSHPGGEDAILGLCGTDGTAAFDDQHGGQTRPERELASFRIGSLKK